MSWQLDQKIEFSEIRTPSISGESSGGLGTCFCRPCLGFLWILPHLLSADIHFPIRLACSFPLPPDLCLASVQVSDLSRLPAWYVIACSKFLDLLVPLNFLQVVCGMQRLSRGPRNACYIPLTSYWPSTPFRGNIVLNIASEVNLFPSCALSPRHRHRNPSEPSWTVRMPFLGQLMWPGTTAGPVTMQEFWIILVQTGNKVNILCTSAAPFMMNLDKVNPTKSDIKDG